MFCTACGTSITQNLNYCSRCGARVEKLATTENASATGYLSMATGFVGLGGLGLTVGLISLLLKHAVNSEVVVMLAVAFLVTVFGMTFMMIRQIARMTQTARISNDKTAAIQQLNAPNTAQLEEMRQPLMSVTENTTRTLGKELVK